MGYRLPFLSDRLHAGYPHVSLLSLLFFYYRVERMVWITFHWRKQPTPIYLVYPTFVAAIA